MTTPGEVFCPYCKRKNKPDAEVCEYCGKSFKTFFESPTTRQVEDGTKLFPEEAGSRVEKIIRQAPQEGMAIYIFDQSQPIAVRKEKEFVIGRIPEESGPAKEPMVDLEPYGAYDSGVSRRHVKVRKTKNGYEVIDLDSTNGTWLNERRLIPKRAYPMISGSQVRLGRMFIFVIYQRKVG